MEIFLDEKGILTHILRPLAELQEKYRLTGNENQETRSAKQKIFDKLSTDDKRCKNYLIQRIDDAHLEYVKGKECAHDVWKALQAVFQRKGIANKILLKRQLHQMRFNPILETMSEYLLRMDKLTRQLREAGVTIDEEDYICNILLSLPPEYDMVATAIETMPASEVNVPFVRNRVLKEEIFMRPPIGLSIGNDKVCRLNKTLYGLKQAPMEWNKEFNSYVRGLGFKQSEYD
jgi:hypothetical protein